MQWDVDNRAHNPKVGGSNPPPATKESAGQAPLLGVGPAALSAGFYCFFYCRLAHSGADGQAGRGAQPP